MLQSGSWPIAAAMLPFPDAHDAPERWVPDLAEVAYEGFTAVDLTDSWLRVGDLAPARRAELVDALRHVGLEPVAVSAIRRSVIDPADGADNLAYSHRTIDAAAELGCTVVSVGLHRPLTEAQRRALWFWTVDGPRDDPEDWGLAVARLRELGEHAASVGLALSLEMYEDTLLGTAASAVRLVRDVDHPAVGLNPDLGNLYRLREIEPFLAAVEACAPHANYWHVKSYARHEDPVVAVPAPMYAGSMNWRAAIKTAVALGYDAPFCVEHYGGDGLAVMAANQQYLRRLLAVALGEHVKELR
jgi:sugar phosphate isomerase/epimerase